MEEYELSKAAAIKHMKVADHILTMTYPLVQDPKLLKLVLKNIYLSLENAMVALLHFERLQKQSIVIKSEFNYLVECVKPYLKKHNISLEYTAFLKELNNIMKKQEKAGVEFIRKEKFVFTGKDYKLNTVTKKEMKDYIIKGKLFMRQVLDVIK